MQKDGRGSWVLALKNFSLSLSLIGLHDVGVNARDDSGGGGDESSGGATRSPALHIASTGESYRRQN